MNIYKKLQAARIKLQQTELRKSGKNKFAGYEYFELSDSCQQSSGSATRSGSAGLSAMTRPTPI
jgi:hypothetical protein